MRGLELGQLGNSSSYSRDGRELRHVDAKTVRIVNLWLQIEISHCDGVAHAVSAGRRRQQLLERHKAPLNPVLAPLDLLGCLLAIWERLYRLLHAHGAPCEPQILSHITRNMQLSSDIE